MIGFEYYNPAKIVFGEGSRTNLCELLSDNNVTSLLLVYSGDFIKTLGIYDVIKDAVERARDQVLRERRSSTESFHRTGKKAC